MSARGRREAHFEPCERVIAEFANVRHFWRTRCPLSDDDEDVRRTCIHRSLPKSDARAASAPDWGTRDVARLREFDEPALNGTLGCADLSRNRSAALAKRDRIERAQANPSREGPTREFEERGVDVERLAFARGKGERGSRGLLHARIVADWTLPHDSVFLTWISDPAHVDWNRAQPPLLCSTLQHGGCVDSTTRPPVRENACMFENVLGLRPVEFDAVRARAKCTRGIERMKDEVDWALLGGLDSIVRAIDILIARYNELRATGSEAVEQLARRGLDLRDVPDEVFEAVIEDEESPLGVAVSSAHESLVAVEEELQRLIAGAADRGAHVVIEKRRA